MKVKTIEEFEKLSREDQDKVIESQTKEMRENLGSCPEALKICEDALSSITEEEYDKMTIDERDDWRERTRAEIDRGMSVYKKHTEKFNRELKEMCKEVEVMIKVVKKEPLTKGEIEIYKRSLKRHGIGG